MQDPIFNALDIAFFERIGYTVLATPQAFLPSIFTLTTFLFAPHLEWEIYIRALRVARPGICVGNDVREYLVGLRDENGVEEEGVREVLEEVLGGMEVMGMPDFERATWCVSTSIYWAKRTDEEKVHTEDIEKGLGQIELKEKNRES